MRAMKEIAKAPIHAYRWTLKPLIGLDAVTADLLGIRPGGHREERRLARGRLALARVCRCHPWGGSHGFDPPPDIAQSGTCLRHGAMAAGACRPRRDAT